MDKDQQPIGSRAQMAQQRIYNITEHLATLQVE